MFDPFRTKAALFLNGSLRFVKIIFLITGMLALSLAGRSQPQLPPFHSRSAANLTLGQLEQLQVGRIFGAFTAMAEDGSMITNKTLAGKVSLVLFWYPGIGFSNRKYVADYLMIDTLAALQKQYKDFQIISLLPDTSGLTRFRWQNPGVNTFTIGKLQSAAVAHELNPGVGMPSCVLVDREGKIIRVSSLGRRQNQEAFADKLKDLMMP